MVNPYHDILTSVIDHSINGGRNATGQMDDLAQGAVKALTGHAKDIENAGNAGQGAPDEEQPGEPEGGDAPPDAAGAPGAPPAASGSGTSPLMQAYLRKVLEAAGEGTEKEENPEGEGTDETDTDDGDEGKESVENVRIYRTASGKLLLIDNCGGKGGTKGPCKGSGKGATAAVKEPSVSKSTAKVPSQSKTTKTPKPSTSTPSVTPTKDKESKTPSENPSKSTGDNCGIGKGGFQKGNACAKGGNSGANKEPTAKAATKSVKPTVDDLHSHIQDLLKNPNKITVKHIEDTATKLMSLTAKDMRIVAEKLGITGLKGSDLKAKLADKISKGSLEGKNVSKDTEVKTDKRQASTKPPGKTAKQPDKQPETSKTPIQAKTNDKLEIKESGVAGSGKVGSRDDFANELKQHLDKEGINKNDTKEINKKVGELMDKYSKPAGSVKPHYADSEDMNVLEMGGIKLHYSKESKSYAANLIRQTLSKNVMPDRLLEATGDITFSSKHAVMDGSVNPYVQGSAGPDGKISFYKHGANVMTLAHEAAHNLAIQKWGLHDPPTDSEYGRAQKEEKPVTDYGATRSAEDFAEAVMMYSIDKNTVKNRFPKKHDAIEKIMNESRAYHGQHRGEKDKY